MIRVFLGVKHVWRVYAVAVYQWSSSWGTHTPVTSGRHIVGYVRFEVFTAVTMKNIYISSQRASLASDS
jgi:spore germination protein YaaH